MTKIQIKMYRTQNRSFEIQMMIVKIDEIEYLNVEISINCYQMNRFIVLFKFPYTAYRSNP